MTRAWRQALLLGCFVASLGCGKKQPRYLEEGEELETEYAPDPTEVPLTADFAQAAKRRVKPDNYRQELSRIERELKLER